MASTSEVQLAIYDLSQGMARSISAQFLGPDHVIEIIPHTGIVVFGNEYFFGGGVQSADPIDFRRDRGIAPIQIQSLGHTSVSQGDFEAWCALAMQTGRYSADAYDLLNRNCNNFCHDAAIEGLRLPQGVPEWITNVPARFLASPMGQMVRPMLEQMQITGPSNAAPFSTVAVAAPASNPWAHMSSASTSTSVPATFPPAGTPVLDSYKRPLLSNDTKTAGVCSKKLQGSATSDEDKAALDRIGLIRTKDGSKPSTDDMEQSAKAILFQLRGHQNTTFALMLLRLVVLHPLTTESPNGDKPYISQCLGWIQQELSGADTTALATAAARSMAWCTLSNALAVSSAREHDSVLNDATVEAALADLVVDAQRIEVRQAAAAFLYNVALVESARLIASVDDVELPDRVVSLLCASLDGVDDEPDTTTKTRRILVAARLVKPVEGGALHLPAKTLVQELGFADSMMSLVNAESATLAKLSSEFVTLINN